MVADLEMLAEALRPLVHDDENPPNKDDAGTFLKVLSAMAKLLGLNAPSQPYAAPEAAGQGESSEDVALFLARLNIWMAKTHTRDEKGWHTPPVLLTGMTERVNVNGNSSMNELGVEGSGGKGMWSMVLENPSDD
jgi:hypothetical protein